MKRAVLLWGLAATAVVGCGLSFGDLPEQADTGATPGTSSPTGSTTTSPTGSTTTSPTPDGSTPTDGSLPGDGGASDATVDAAPPKPSGATVTIRFDRNGPLLSLTKTETYTDGVFQGKALYRGPSIDVLDAPRSGPTTGPFAPALFTNAASASFGSAGSTNAVDIDNAQALLTAGTTYDKFTLTAWVKRATTGGADTREATRILSFGETAGNNPPFFELGMYKQTDEKLMVSIGGAIGKPGDKMSGQKILDQTEWTFIAVTYDANVGGGKDLCFYAGNVNTPAAESSCEGYGGKSFTRGTANMKLTVGNSANDAVRSGASKVSFAGKIDEVNVYLGQTLPLAELQKIQKE